MSAVAKKIAGLYVEDSGHNVPPVARWLQEECRSGLFARALRQFSAEQVEQPDATLALIESVTPEGVWGRLPCRVVDHESPHTVAVDVFFRLDPATGSVERDVREGGVPFPVSFGIGVD